MNKKNLPFILLAVGIVVFLGIIFMVKRSQNSSNVVNNQNESEIATEIPADQMRSAALIPSSDGYILTLKINGIKVSNATSMDYEVLWKANNAGVPSTQGTSATVQLSGASSITKDLLLGSESSGKKRYDIGVETGGLTLRFRDSNGKLLGRLSTDFHLQSGVTELTSVDGKFKYTLNKIATGVFFITMQTFAAPDSVPMTSSNGYAIFASDGLPHAGK